MPYYIFVTIGLAQYMPCAWYHCSGLAQANTKALKPVAEGCRADAACAACCVDPKPRRPFSQSVGPAAESASLAKVAV